MFQGKKYGDLNIETHSTLKEAVRESQFSELSPLVMPVQIIKPWN